MGNVLHDRSSLLAKHWNQVAPNTYRNTITEELIDSHLLGLHSEEEMTFNNSLLMKRAALSHPNVPKLIYFTPSSTPFCGSSSHSITLYLEHTQPLIKVGQSSTVPLCPCCSIVSGLLYLSDRYGWFTVNQTLVRGGLESGLQGKLAIVPKVWINSDLKMSYPSATTTEPQMCQQTALLLLALKNSHCSLENPLPSDLLRVKSLNELVEAVYELHSQTPQQPPRKRVASQYNQPPGPTLEETPPRQQSRPLIHCISKDSLQYRAIQPTSTKESISQKMQWPLSKPTHQRQGNLNQPVTGRTSRRVNFSFTDSLATPKTSKHPPLPKKIDQVPAQEIKMEKPPTTHQISSSTKEVTQFIQTEMVPSLLPSFRKQETDLFIQEQQSESRLKQLLLATDRDPSFSTLVTQPTQFSPISTLQPQTDPQPIQSLNKESGQEVHPQTQQTKEMGLGQKKKSDDKPGAEQILGERGSEKGENEEKDKQSRIDINSMGSGNNEKSIGFEIVSQYHLSLEPQVALPNFTMQQSVEFVCSEPERTPHQTSVFQGKVPPIDQSLKNYAGNRDEAEIGASKGADQGRTNAKEKGYTKYLKNFKEVVLTESNFQSSHTPRSERHYSSKQTHHQVFGEKRDLTSSNNPNKFKKGPAPAPHDYPPESSSTMMEAAPFSKQDGAQSVESQSCDEQRKRKRIMAKISSTEEVLRENRKKLQRLQLEKDLEREKNLIKKEMESLLVSNMMADESHRIKEKVKYKKATFAELKAEASKILEDLDF